MSTTKPVEQSHASSLVGDAGWETSLELDDIYQDFESDLLPPNEIQPIRWNRSHKPMGRDAVCLRMGLPTTIAPALLNYFSPNLVDYLYNVLYNEDQRELERHAHVSKRIELQLGNKKQEWVVERPGDFQSCDMIFFIPATHQAHESVLDVLGRCWF